MREIRTIAGDYGTPIAFRLQRACDCAADGVESCGCDELVESDVVELVVTRGDTVCVLRRSEVRDLVDDALILETTAQESEGMAPGLYAWALKLIREGESKKTLASGMWYVAPAARGG